MHEIRLLDSLDAIPAHEWDRLNASKNPFVSHAFLHGLEQHGCIRRSLGWSPRHLTLWERGRLVAAMPGYRKTNSHGEFVFDHAWARAYATHGMDYFPKWLCAVPYSPVTGPRLLVLQDPHRDELVRAARTLCMEEGLSSAHVNFHESQEGEAFDSEWLPRVDIQFQWTNQRGWTEFDAFLNDLDHRHRKNIRQERAKVSKAGVTFRVVHGNEASADDLATMYDFYRGTFAEYGNQPALTLAFLEHLAETMPRALVLVFGQSGGRTLAGALLLRGRDTLYGRYWGANEHVPGLHFETCYYQGIEYCLREGLTRFEPGAQGEHKLARGFLPTYVHSRHWIAHEGFREALRGWCEEEGVSVRRYAATLAAHSPFKAQ